MGWLNINPNHTEDSGTTEVSFIPKENTSSDERRGIIKFTAGDAKHDISVSQSKYNDNLINNLRVSFSTLNLNFGDIATFTVTANSEDNIVWSTKVWDKESTSVTYDEFVLIEESEDKKTYSVKYGKNKIDDSISVKKKPYLKLAVTVSSTTPSINGEYDYKTLYPMLMSETVKNEYEAPIVEYSSSTVNSVSFFVNPTKITVESETGGTIDIRPNRYEIYWGTSPDNLVLKNTWSINDETWSGDTFTCVLPEGANKAYFKARALDSSYKYNPSQFSVVQVGTLLGGGALTTPKVSIDKDIDMTPEGFRVRWTDIYAGSYNIYVNKDSNAEGGSNNYATYEDFESAVINGGAKIFYSVTGVTDYYLKAHTPTHGESPVTGSSYMVAVVGISKYDGGKSQPGIVSFNWNPLSEYFITSTNYKNNLIERTGGSVTYDIITTDSWSVECDENGYTTASTKSGSSGISSVTLSVGTTKDERNGYGKIKPTQQGKGWGSTKWEWGQRGDTYELIPSIYNQTIQYSERKQSLTIEYSLKKNGEEINGLLVSTDSGSISDIVINEDSKKISLSITNTSETNYNIARLYLSYSGNTNINEVVTFVLKPENQISLGGVEIFEYEASSQWALGRVKVGEEVIKGVGVVSSYVCIAVYLPNDKSPENCNVEIQAEVRSGYGSLVQSQPINTTIPYNNGDKLIIGSRLYYGVLCGVGGYNARFTKITNFNVNKANAE